MSERDRSRNPDHEVFDREINWPKPRPDPPEEPIHPDTTPLDDEDDNRWR